jgi:hypothetical protein
MRRLITGLLFLSAGVPLAGPAFGQAACAALDAGQCACAAPLASFTPGSATLHIRGSVLVDAQNPGSDPSAAVLSVGDSAVVLERGSASLNFPGACSASLAPQSSLVIREINGCACASVFKATTAAATVPEGGAGASDPTGGATGPGTDTQNDAGGVSATTVLGVAAATAAVGTAAYFVITNDDDEKGSEE